MVKSGLTVALSVAFLGTDVMQHSHQALQRLTRDIGCFFKVLS